MLSIPTETTPGIAPTSTRGRARFWLGVSGLAAGLVLAQLLHPQHVLRLLAEHTRQAGPLGPALLAALYLPAALTGVPLALLTLTAGWLFGPAIGFLLAVPACTVGSCAAFAVGRALAGDPQFLARGSGRIARAARELGTRQGLWAMVLLRLVPFTPFSVLNFAFGATPIAPRTYALATFIGSIPACLALSFAGAWLSGLR